MIQCMGLILVRMGSFFIIVDLSKRDNLPFSLSSVFWAEGIWKGNGCRYAYGMYEYTNQILFKFGLVLL